MECWSSYATHSYLNTFRPISPPPLDITAPTTHPLDHSLSLPHAVHSVRVSSRHLLTMARLYDLVSVWKPMRIYLPVLIVILAAVTRWFTLGMSPTLDRIKLMLQQTFMTLISVMPSRREDNGSIRFLGDISKTDLRHSIHSTNGSHQVA